MRLKQLWSVQAGLFLALWLGLMLFGRSTLLRDPGTFWHLAVGRQILRSEHLVRADTFSFTRQGSPWVDGQWLAECAMAGLDRLGGWDALLLAVSALLAALYTAIGSRLMRAGLGVMPTLVVLTLVLLASTHQFHARPLILSMIFLGWTFSLLVDVESGRQPLGRLWWLVPLLVVWANCHGGVLAGLGTLGLVALGWVVVWLAGGDGPVRGPRSAITLAALVVVAMASVLINPWGIDLPRTWFAVLRLPLQDLIQEHAPLSLAKPYGWAVVALMLGYVGILLRTLPTRAAVHPTEPGVARSGDRPQRSGYNPWGWRGLRPTWLVPLVWFVLACERVRNAPLLAITLVIALADLLNHSRGAAWLHRRGMFVPGSSAAAGRPIGLHGARLPIAALALALSFQAGSIRVPVIGHGWARLDPAYWPIQLLPALEAIEHNEPAVPPAPGTRIFNDMLFGGFLIFHTPQLQIFIDDRCELYGRDFLLAYDRARQGEPAQLETWCRQYGFRHALVERGSAFDLYLDGNQAWECAGRDDAARLYRRKMAGEPSHLDFQAKSFSQNVQIH